MAATKAHVLVIPWPGQGHINPSLAFANRLASDGLHVTYIITTDLKNKATFSNCNKISIQHISDGSEHVKGPESFEEYFKRFKAVLSSSLAEFIDQQKASGSAAPPPKLIVYDSTMPWVLDIAHERGLLGAPFFTQSAAVCAVFYHLKQGTLKFPFHQDCTSEVLLPSLPSLQVKDLPNFSQFMDSNQTVVKLLGDQFSNLERPDWIFFNTFQMLEQEVVEWLESKWPIKTVGPTFLLEEKYDKSSDNKNHDTISLFEPKHDACREWLDSREAGSVVYVSFGSIASLGKEQMEEVAHALLISKCHFLWVVRSSEADKLPENFHSEKGLIVEWCNQRQVLAHRALACFMTHCGWNSTLEALSHGVPLIAMAQWIDQTTNAKFIADVWGVGVGVGSASSSEDDGVIIGRERIAMCIEQVVVEGERSVELRKNACKFKKLAHEAVQCGGTSANNIQHFLSKLLSC